MVRLKRVGKVAIVALAALTIALGVNAPSQAAGMGGGHGSGGGHTGGVHGGYPSGFGASHPGQVGGHHGFEGHHFDRGGHDRFRFGVSPVFPYYGYAPYYGYYPYDARAYWYYCPSYGAYYPNVSSCPEEWVPVPAS